MLSLSHYLPCLTAIPAAIRLLLSFLYSSIPCSEDFPLSFHLGASIRPSVFFTLILLLLPTVHPSCLNRFSPFIRPLSTLVSFFYVSLVSSLLFSFLAFSCFLFSFTLFQIALSRCVSLSLSFSQLVLLLLRIHLASCLLYIHH